MVMIFGATPQAFWQVHKFSAITLSVFLTKDDLDTHHIGFGDDVFMLGLFIDHRVLAQKLA